MADALDQVSAKQARRMRTLGHALHQLAGGIDLLRRRVQRDRLHDRNLASWLTPWLTDLSNRLPLPVNSSGYTLIAAREDGSWRVIRPHAVEGNESISDTWVRALVLLHLPALREYWTHTLRRHRFNRLRTVLPRAIPLEDGQIPPGAVVAGLDELSASQPRTLSDGPAPASALVAETGPKPDEQVLRVRWHTDGEGRIVY